MDVRFSRPALQQVDQMLAAMGEGDVDEAARMAMRIERILHVLLRFPQLGRRTDMTDVRIVAVPGLPYWSLYVQPDDEGLRVLRLRHGRQWQRTAQ